MKVFALLLFATAALADLSAYAGYKVYQIIPINPYDIKVLSQLENRHELDFWSPLNRHGKPVVVMVPPNAQMSLLEFLNTHNIFYHVLIENVNRIVDEEFKTQQAHQYVRGTKIDFKKYYTHQETNNYLDELAQTYPEKVTIENIGKSYEGRNLTVIKISTNPSANKPTIFIDGGIHAREWLSPAQVLYIIQQLVENSENSNLLEKVDWHILPIVNPDGYEYTQRSSNNRFWRKTRSRGRQCVGTDGNRNFGFHWGEIGASANECTETYRGASAFSELETQAVRDYVLKNKDNIKLYLTFHSYGEYLLYPWGFTSALPEDADELQALGDLVADTIYNVKGTIYTVGSSTNVLYAAAGGSDDWAKAVGGVELSYTIELPGGGSQGFDPPASSILGHVSETWTGVKVYHDYIAEKFNN